MKKLIKVVGILSVIGAAAAGVKIFLDKRNQL